MRIFTFRIDCYRLFALFLLLNLTAAQLFPPPETRPPQHQQQQAEDQNDDDEFIKSIQKSQQKPSDKSSTAKKTQDSAPEEDEDADNHDYAEHVFNEDAYVMINEEGEGGRKIEDSKTSSPSKSQQVDDYQKRLATEMDAKDEDGQESKPPVVEKPPPKPLTQEQILGKFVRLWGRSGRCGECPKAIIGTLLPLILARDLHSPGAEDLRECCHQSALYRPTAAPRLSLRAHT